MALTPEQEADLLKSNEEMKKTLAALAPEVTTLKTQLAEKDTAINDLKSKQQTASQEQALLALKATCPDVPDEVLKALPEAVRAAEGAKLQASYSKLKSTTLKTGSDAWNNIGGIAPSVEAEDAAQLAARETARTKAVQSGNFMDVLRIKSRDTVEFVKKNYSTR